MAKKINSKKALKLKQQLAGKPTISTPRVTTTPTITHTGFTLPTTQSSTPITHSSIQTDTAYLHRDLTKIAILSAIAIGAQLGLFFALRNGLTIRGF